MSQNQCHILKGIAETIALRGEVQNTKYEFVLWQFTCSIKRKPPHILEIACNVVIT